LVLFGSSIPVELADTLQSLPIFGSLVAKMVADVAIWFDQANADRNTNSREGNMPAIDHRHRNHDGEIGHKHGSTLVGTLRKIYGQGFAAGYPATEKLSEVLLQLNETSLSQLRRDYETGHLEHKIAKASK
jgi:hypothetical protein